MSDVHYDRIAKIDCLKISCEALSRVGNYAAGPALKDAQTFFAWVSEEAAIKKPSTKAKTKKK